MRNRLFQWDNLRNGLIFEAKGVKTFKKRAKEVDTTTTLPPLQHGRLGTHTGMKRILVCVGGINVPG